MPTWQQEMGWYCATCEKLNRGRYKECQNCGKPKEREPFVDLPGEGEGIEWAVKGPELVKQAEAGSDWECIFCRSHQRRDNGECANCGAVQGESRDHATKWDDGTVGPGGSGLTEQEAIEAEIADQEQEQRAKAIEGQSYRGRKRSRMHLESEFEAVTSEVKPPFWNRQKKVGAGVMLGVALVGLILFLLFRTRIVDATVTAVFWEHKVHVERYQIQRGEGFDEDQPGDAFDVESHGTRHHHYKKVPDGTKQVPYTERYACGTTPRVCTTTPVRCTTNNNGFKTCTGGDQRCTGGDTKYCTRTKYRTETKYKDVSVRETWYSWKVWRWGHNRTVAEQGNDLEPRWPTAEKVALNKRLGTGEKERERKEARYQTTFRDEDGDVHEYTPKSLAEYQSLPLGAKKRLKVSVAGSPEILPDAK